MMNGFVRDSGHQLIHVAQGEYAASILALLAGQRRRIHPPEPDKSPDSSAALCGLIQYCTKLDLHREPGEQLPDFLRQCFDLEAVALLDADMNRTYRAGQWFADPENTLRNIYLFERSTSDPETGLHSEVLRIGRLPIGALLLRGDIDRGATLAIANLVAIAFDRFHSRANLSRTESARETERLRTTVLDSLAHAYKTPLTAVQAAATGLHEIGLPTPAHTDLVTLIIEQTAALNDLTMRLLGTARLEAHDVSLHVEAVALAALVDDVAAMIRARSPGIRIRISIQPEDVSVHCDRVLLASLLTQYVDNAAKYSHHGSPVSITVTQEGESLLFAVHNFGPAIPVAEYERVFDRYARSAGTSSSVSGTGIGLSIARSAAQAHGGDVWVYSDPVDGTTFWASLPLRSKESPTHG
jgi:two-component system sensor histidine kinase KdpD